MQASDSTKCPTVVITNGASFVGRAIITRLLSDYRVIGVGDQYRSDALKQDNKQNLEWRYANLFSLLETEKALEGVEYALYIDHATLPYARLTQGKFQDLNIIMADNFARAARKAGSKQIIYLYGLFQKEKGKKTAYKYNSQEVEEVLRSHGVPLTVLRAVKSDIQPSTFENIVELLAACIGNEEMYERSIDVNVPNMVEDVFFPARKRKLSKKKYINTVRSVQRFILPKGKDAVWIGKNYVRWLSGYAKPFIRVRETPNGQLHFSFPGIKKPLLELTYSVERSTSDRVLYYIIGGLLAHADNKRYRGRLEFREILDGKYIVAAIHEFIPRLPWSVYSVTQALVHLWVMRSYGQYLRNQAE
jgi:NAD(P)-dependent dehydrogenase (short-subunit alcohol dehydrogenase family)